MCADALSRSVYVGCLRKSSCNLLLVCCLLLLLWYGLWIHFTEQHQASDADIDLSHNAENSIIGRNSLSNKTTLTRNNQQPPNKPSGLADSLSKSEVIESACKRIKKYNMTMCYYANKNNDRFISKKIIQGGYFEGNQVDLVLKWLKLDPELSLVDLGTNIGTYTLPAAAAGRQVISVEPYPPNINLLTRSLHLSGLDNNVTIVPCGVSGKREVLRLLLDYGNRGHLELVSECAPGGSDCSEFLVAGLLLDDVPAFRPSVTRAIVKMDIEGSERQTLLGSTTFLSTLKVPILLMEWQWFPLYYSKKPEEVVMSEEMISHLQNQSYVPHHPLKGHELQVQHWKKKWPVNVAWVRKDFIEPFKRVYAP